MTAAATLAGVLTSTDDCDWVNWVIQEAGYDPLREGEITLNVALDVPDTGLLPEHIRPSS